MVQRKSCYWIEDRNSRLVSQLPRSAFQYLIDFGANMRSMALSKKAKIIVSGHEDGTIRRWNGHNGESISEPVSGDLKEVLSMAIGGNLIVSGSVDGLLHRSNVTTGETIGNALQGHGGSVNCVAVSADRKLIVSVSRYGTITRWDAGTGDPVGSDLLAYHHQGVTSWAISSDVNFLV